MGRWGLLITGCVGLSSLLAGCAKVGDTPAPASNCITSEALEKSTTQAGETGAAFAFLPDPIVSSGDPHLSPVSTHLDDFRKEVTLERLTGKGVLSGKFIDVRNRLQCGGNYNAFDATNQFKYSQADGRFQEAMSYYFGDTFRSLLNDAGYLLPEKPMVVIAHCENGENAYYEAYGTGAGRVEYVCLDDSIWATGSSYADDGEVLVHELQHAATTHAYGDENGLGELLYDEAGAMNEGVSDFMALMFAKEMIPDGTDDRMFSRWALGQFGSTRATRGAHRCPEYDPTFPECGNFRSDESGFSSARNTISYVYPDGLGWPFADNYQAPNQVHDVFYSYRYQEEIHNLGLILTGALYEMFEELEKTRGTVTARILATKLTMDAIRNLPQPSALISFMDLTRNILALAPFVGLTDAEITSVQTVFRERGFYNYRAVPRGWAAAGMPGEPASSSLKIVDSPAVLRSWLSRLDLDISKVKQGESGGLNRQLDSGEVDAIWFNIANTSERTAGGLLLTITSLHPGVTFLQSPYNRGYLSANKVRVRYSKVNGSAIVDALNQDAGFQNFLPVGTTYFTTNPSFDGSGLDGSTRASLPFTAVWVQVDPAAGLNQEAEFRVEVQAANAERDEAGTPASETLSFKTMINVR